MILILFKYSKMTHEEPEVTRYNVEHFNLTESGNLYVKLCSGGYVTFKRKEDWDLFSAVQ